MSAFDMHLSCNLKCILWYIVPFIGAYYLLKFTGVFRYIQLKLQVKIMTTMGPKGGKLPLVISAKTELFKSLHDFKTKPRILEVGAGDCRNLEYYPRGSRYIVVEPNEHFHEPLTKRIKEVGPELVLEKVHAEYAEKLTSVEDESVDAYVMTHVTCSISHLDSVLQEARRVLKPGGHLYIFHHFLGPNAKLTGLRATLERTFFKHVAGVIMECDMDKQIEADIRRHFPKTDSKTMELPYKFMPLRYHLISESIKT